MASCVNLGTQRDPSLFWSPRRTIVLLWLFFLNLIPQKLATTDNSFTLKAEFIGIKTQTLESKITLLNPNFVTYQLCEIGQLNFSVPQFSEGSGGKPNNSINLMKWLWRLSEIKQQAQSAVPGTPEMVVLVSIVHCCEHIWLISPSAKTSNELVSSWVAYNTELPFPMSHVG